MAVEHPRSGWERQGTVLRKAALAIFALWPTSRSRGSLEAKPEVKEDDQFSDAETVARREAALKRTLPTPHMANPKRELSGSGAKRGRPPKAAKPARDRPADEPASHMLTSGG